MNWGKGIMLFYICFVVGISMMVYRTFFIKQELIQENYYEAELLYQDELDASKRASELREKPNLLQIGDSIFIQWGRALRSRDFNGELTIICPNDAKQDKLIKINHQSNQPDQAFIYQHHGYRLVKLNWILDGKRYMYSFHQTF